MKKIEIKRCYDAFCNPPFDGEIVNIKISNKNIKCCKYYGVEMSKQNIYAENFCENEFFDDKYIDVFYVDDFKVEKVR